MSTRVRLLQLLNDQHFQSGSELGRRLGVSRAAIQQQVAAMRADGVPIHGVPRQGYRLAKGVSLLDADRITAALPAPARAQVTSLCVLARVDSTSNELLRHSQQLHGAVCLAENQEGGRGRRGKQWVGTPYRNLMLSLGWVYADWPPAISALGLVAALAVSRALQRCGVPGIGIKWPNDLVWQSKKLGGILVDLSGETGGTCRVVVGVGINVALTGKDAAGIDQPWVDMATIMELVPDRNKLAAVVVAELLTALGSFATQGFAGAHAEWCSRHVLEGREVEILVDQTLLTGRVLGVDENGALLVRDPAGRQHRFYHGEVSLRTWR